MLQTDHVIGSPLNHQDPFIQRHGSQLTANELPPFRLPFTSRRGIRLAYSFPGPARGARLGKSDSSMQEDDIPEGIHFPIINKEEMKSFEDNLKDCNSEKLVVSQWIFSSSAWLGLVTWKPCRHLSLNLTLQSFLS